MILINGYLPHPSMGALLRRCVSSVSSQAGQPTLKKKSIDRDPDWVDKFFFYSSLISIVPLMKVGILLVTRDCSVPEKKLFYDRLPGGVLPLIKTGDRKVFVVQRGPV